MTFREWRQERRIRRLLRKFSQQRVRGVLQPGNIWVVERSVDKAKHSDGDFQTCLLRGWLEVFEENIPHGKVDKNGRLPKGPIFQSEEPIYRLTGEGWAIINRDKSMSILSLVVAILALTISLNT